MVGVDVNVCCVGAGLTQTFLQITVELYQVVTISQIYRMPSHADLGKTCDHRPFIPPFSR